MAYRGAYMKLWAWFAAWKDSHGKVLRQADIIARLKTEIAELQFKALEAQAEVHRELHLRMVERAATEKLLAERKEAS